MYASDSPIPLTLRMSPSNSKQPSLPARLIAELGIIVLGVLIALWADEWVAERADRQVERNRIEALRDNLDATRVRLDEAVEETRAAQEALTLAAYWQDPATLSQRHDVVLLGLMYGPVFTPEINVYDDLKNSGDLGLLTNAELRQALAHMDAVFEELALLQSDVTMVQQLNVDSFLMQELGLGATMGPYLGLEDLPVDVPNPDIDMQRLRNLSLFKLDLVRQLHVQYKRAVEALNEVEHAMNQGDGEEAPHR